MNRREINVVAERLHVKSIITALVALVVAALASPAFAQGANEFVKVDGATREVVPPLPFLAGAYAFIWVAVLVYVVTLARGLGRVRGEIEDLRKRIDSGQ